MRRPCSSWMRGRIGRSRRASDGHEKLRLLGRVQSRQPPPCLVQWGPHRPPVADRQRGVPGAARAHRRGLRGGLPPRRTPPGHAPAATGRSGCGTWQRGEEVARLPGHTSYVWSLAFSPDGQSLVSGSGDFTVRLWDTAPLKVRYQARREADAVRPEAERLVAGLFAERREPAEVVARLLADQTLNEPLRRAALRAVMRRAHQFTP